MSNPTDRLASTPEAELRADLTTAKFDLAYCRAAIRLGIGQFAETRRRERANQAIIDLIEAELERRGIARVVAVQP